MTGPELKAALDKIGMGQNEYARVIGRDRGYVSRMANGERSISHERALLLTIMIEEPDIAAKVLSGAYL